MALLSDYFRELRHWTDKYGKNTILFNQQGTFYECYGYDPKEAELEKQVDFYGERWSQPLGFWALSHTVEQLEDLLHADLTKKNKKAPYSLRDNVHMLGFPITKYDKRRRALLAQGYTVVRKDEVKVGKDVHRVVGEIASPYTDLEVETSKSNTVVAVYLEHQNGTTPSSMEVVAGIALLDVVTGVGRVAEFYSLPDDSHIAVQQLFRVLTSVRPREVVAHLVDFPKPEEFQDWLELTLESHRFDRWVPYLDKVQPEMHKKSYHLDFFNTLFPLTAPSLSVSGLNVVSCTDPRVLERLSLDGMVPARMAYILLVQHYKEFTSGVTTALQPPEVSWIDSETHLVLAHNAALQLNLLENQKITKDTLFGVIDKTRTKIGSRRLKNLILHPITNVATLNDSYAVVGELVDSIKSGKGPSKCLDLLPDFEKLHRKLSTGFITPKETGILYNGYSTLVKLYSEAMLYPLLRQHLLTPEVVSAFNLWLTHYTQIVHWDALSDCVIGTTETGIKYVNFKKWPLHQVLTNEVGQLEKAEKLLLDHVNHLNSVSDAGVKLEQQKKVGGTKKLLPLVVTVTTQKKAQMLLRSEYDVTRLGKLSLTKDTESRQLVHSPVIDELLTFIETSRSHLRVKLLQEWKAIIHQMSDHSTKFYREIERMVGMIDVWWSFALHAHSSDYVRPEIVEDGEDSFVEAENLRHPIIEKIISGKYVTNDLSLRQDGILLHGLNQVGKSSLAKAVPLNIVLAQIGSWTAGKLRYRPYTKIITRLQGGDNMSGGESTFSMEMTELRTILRQADSRTLVVGDELAHSSDVYSAAAITVAAVDCLSEVRAAFIFATHLHDVLEIDEIKSLVDTGRVRPMHLSTSKSPDGLVVYDRKLKSGPGDAVYGVLVAESLDLPSNFIKKAYSVLSRITKNQSEVVSTQVSKYNSNVHVTRCAVCHRGKEQAQLHTHHIEEQHTAGLNGLIHTTQGVQHKNNKDNLIVLCDSCHESIHAGTPLQTLETALGRLVVRE